MRHHRRARFSRSSSLFVSFDDSSSLILSLAFEVRDGSMCLATSASMLTSATFSPRPLPIRTIDGL
eukprot:scaffold263_cov251-Pinguiococcus_pyrenoidosus.AAC.16